MSDPYDDYDDEELDTRKPWFLRIVAGIVIVALLFFIVDLFVDLVLRWVS